MKKYVSYWISYTFVALSCREVPSTSDAREKRIADAERRIEAQSIEIDEIDKQVNNLTSEWADLTSRYKEISSTYKQSSKASTAASRSYGDAVDKNQQAAAIAEEAQTRWRFFQELIMAAAAIDAANLDAARAVPGSRPAINCAEAMSTSSYRRLLANQGVDLSGMDVDHIVPRSLGGADHPENYQLLSASTNRSLGNTWNEAKCASVGPRRCVKAISASRKCGSFKGTAF
jgi:5-methylcytosine-specific restriction endonuclease McrA